MKRLSLRLRLILIFSLLALMTWCTASVVAWVMSRNTINEVFDTQQMLFAKRLATANLGDLLADESARSLPKTKKLVHHGKRGDQDDDALAFAIFDRQGKMLLNDGENGADFLFDGEREGPGPRYRRLPCRAGLPGALDPRHAAAGRCPGSAFRREGE